MKIGITGSNGIFGLLVMHELKKDGHEFVRFGRESADIFWTLGVYPEPEVLNDLDVLIHFAWSTRDRRKDFHLNVGGTWRLAQLAKIVGIPFLFISSDAAQSQSHYGQSKLKAEELVIQENGFVSRFGLIIDGNNYDVTRATRFLSLRGRALVSRTSLGDAVNHIGTWLKNCNEEALTNKPSDVTTDQVSITQHFKRQGAKIGVSMKLLSLLFQIGSAFSLKIRNYEDALKSISTHKINRRTS